MKICLLPQAEMPAGYYYHHILSTDNNGTFPCFLQNGSSQIEAKWHYQNFFTLKAKQPNIWICKCGTKRKKLHLGWIKLQHFESKTGETIKALTDCQAAFSIVDICSPFQLSIKALKTWVWLKLVMNRVYSFNFVENRNVRQYIQYDPICYNTFIG